jgi:sec-independent protein translocase protein TatA
LWGNAAAFWKGVPMAPSWIQILIVIVLLVLLFGRGKISSLMGDVAEGIKSFKKGLADDDTDDRKAIDNEPTEQVADVEQANNREKT